MAKRITNDDRREIERLWKTGSSAKSIAERIGVSHITILRELERGYDNTAIGYGRTGYSAAIAIRDAEYKQSLMDAGRRKARERRLLRHEPEQRKAL